jgi:hypothetical protein
MRLLLVALVLVTACEKPEKKLLRLQDNVDRECLAARLLNSPHSWSNELKELQQQYGGIVPPDTVARAMARRDTMAKSAQVDCDLARRKLNKFMN